MKPTRLFATASLVISSVALITAASISVGDEPGVVRMATFSSQAGTAPVPTPDSGAGDGVATMNQPPAMDGVYPQPGNYAPYFERSFAVTEAAPNVFYQPPQPYGPVIMFESNINEGLGFTDGSQRINARVPYHIIPNTNLLIGDLSASVTWDGRPIANSGLVYRRYDDLRNRVFGVNAFLDYDQGRAGREWYRSSVGFESLGRYVDFRANGYFVLGDDSVLLSDTLISGLAFQGNGIFRQREQVRDNAYSGADFELGGPLPVLGQYGHNLYGGAYYLGNNMGRDTVGFQARWEMLVTHNLTVNTRFTDDDTFGTNAFVNIQYEIPNYKTRAAFRPRASVRERLMDPVVRHNRVHTNIDTNIALDAVINNGYDFNNNGILDPGENLNCDGILYTGTGGAYFVMHVNPDAAGFGDGTFENPFSTLQAAALANNAGVDILRVAPRADDSGTNLTVNGGLALFDNQILLSTLSDFNLGAPGTTDNLIIGTPTDSGLGPMISNPTMGVGGSVVRLVNNNRVVGMQLDASNADNTIFGNGFANALPMTHVTLASNSVFNYEFGASLQDVSGKVNIVNNQFNGLLGASVDGLSLTSAAGSEVNLLLAGNSATNNSGAGYRVIARPGSTINADDPDGDHCVTGIVNNSANDNGSGFVLEAQAGATFNALVEDNTALRNTFDGLAARADGGQFNLVSMANNVFSSNLNNGAFLHYLNGGVFRSVSEDLNGNGILDIGEDLNGNGRLDLGIVSNTMNDNSIAGICIFGEGVSVGQFDIGGPDPLLGNIFRGNREGGVLADLRDSATAQIDALFNTIEGGSSVPGLTIVLDFVDPGQGSQIDGLGRQVDTFDIAPWGFNAAQYDAVTQAILDTVRSYYSGLPTVGDNPLSGIPVGEVLNLDFVIGDAGMAPSNGATEYYVVTIGDSAVNLGGLAGQAADIGNIRNAAGLGPGQGLGNVPLALGGSAAGVYTNMINQFSPLLNPPNAFNGPREDDVIYIPTPAQTPQNAITGLTSGNLTFTRRALGLIIAHELGHSLSLRHIENGSATTPNGLNPIMGTPAIDAPLQVLLEPAEFALQGTNPGEIPGEVPFAQFDIAQLATAIGTRADAGQTNAGFRVNATDNARLLASTFNNNTITGARQDGIAIVMNDNAVAEGVTIQGNTITNGGGNGVRLEANGPNAEIHADNTIGGFGINVYNGNAYTQGNELSNNAGDGFRALAANGGTVNGNLLNNRILNNGGNGAALMIDNGGFVDFGTVANNRVIRGNVITGNGGAGLLLNQLTSPTTEAQLDATVLGNNISDNVSGGIVSRLNGANNSPPAPPLIQNNNRLNLVVGGTGVNDSNTISGNGDVGIGVNVTGNGNANVTLENVTVTGTVDGPDPLLNGDGINLRRADSSVLTATLNRVTATGNAGDGINVDTQGSDRHDLNLPVLGTPNTVVITDSNFSNNGANGGFFRTRGNSQLITDITGSTFRANGENGILVQTSENSSFGDPTDGLPPGRRSVFDGLFVEGNGNDGIQVVATDSSRTLLEVTSTAVPASGSPHAAAGTLGATNILNNGRDGIRITTTGGGSDILITAGSATTTIAGNGTVAGGNGIRWDASGNSFGVVRVTNTFIRENIAGASEDTNGNGVLDPGEDLNNNDDIDVADGDGIQANFSGNTVATLVIGGVGEGNTIQRNGDDGIAITATGSNTTGNPRPIITITDNIIGGTFNGLQAGNGGDGVSLNIFGGTAVGIPTGSVDFTLPGLSPNGGVTESGPIPQFTMTENLVSNNNGRGVNLLLTGAAGRRSRENGLSIFDPVRIRLDDNTIVSNGSDGIYYRADSDMNQSRFVYLANFPDPPVLGLDNQNFSPFRPEFLNLNVGSVNGNTAYLPAYLNLRTVQNSLLTVTNNTVQNNGTNTIFGAGVRIDVGTGAYVAADIRNNAFGGNLNEDLITSSFLSAGNTFDSNDTSGDLTFDYIYLDDTAQLDLRFLNNSGDEIAPSDFGALYTNFDALKAQFFGPVGVTFRDASLFQVDNGPNLNNPNNVFTNFGVTQDIQAEFTGGGYNLRGAADPAWPNIGFPPFLP